MTCRAEPRSGLAASPVGRRFLFALLYLSEGAPIGFIYGYLQVQLARENVGPERIGALLSCVLLPWTFKFAWAPLVDVLRGPRWGLRAWVLAAQAVMALTVLPLGWLDLAGDFSLVVGLVAAHAFAAATQDVAIDAWAVRLVPEGERGATTGWMQFGSRLGGWLFGSLTLILVARLGDDPRVVVGLLAVTVLAVGVVLALFGGSQGDPSFGDEPRERLAHFFETMGRALRRRAIWAALAFGLVGCAAHVGLLATYGGFMVARGFGDAAIGWMGTAALACYAPGALLGGKLADALGRPRAILLGLVAAALAAGATGAFAAAVAAPAGKAAVVVGIALVYLAAGALSAALFALFLDLADPTSGATQFSALVGATNGCEWWTTLAVGAIAGKYGYGVAYLVLAAAAVPAVALLPYVRERRAKVAASGFEVVAATGRTG